MTLEKELEMMDEKTITQLTDEIVANTVSGRLKNGKIKTMCSKYNLDLQKVYTAIQKEANRRLRTRRLR